VSGNAPDNPFLGSQNGSWAASHAMSTLLTVCMTCVPGCSTSCVLQVMQGVPTTSCFCLSVHVLYIHIFVAHSGCVIASIHTCLANCMCSTMKGQQPVQPGRAGTYPHPPFLSRRRRMLRVHLEHDDHATYPWRPYSQTASSDVYDTYLQSSSLKLCVKMATVASADLHMHHGICMCYIGPIFSKWGAHLHVLHRAT
jgi:hypothetical protein